MKRKLHFSITEEGKADFGFEVVTDLSDMDIVCLLNSEEYATCSFPPTYGTGGIMSMEKEKSVADDVKRRGAFVHPEDRRPELNDLMTRTGLPGELQREIYNATLPILKKYRATKKSHMNKDRILGLASEALTEAWISGS